MPKIFYQQDGVDPTQIFVWADPATEDTDELGNDTLTALQQLQTLGDESLALLAGGGIPGLVPPQPDLQTLKDFIDKEVNRRRDILDYPSYDLKTEQILNVFDGMWMLPEAVESVSHENVGEEGPLSIDGLNTTWWQSDQAGLRVATYRLRTYTKRLERIRLRSPVGDLRAQLQNVTIKVANTIANLDSNVVDSGVNFTHAGNDWIEHPFPSPHNGLYIRIETDDSLHASDHIRIREVQSRVITRRHDS